MKEEVRHKVLEELSTQLKPKVEQIINAELSTKLASEIARGINQELEKFKIKATVTANVAPMTK
jgi:hypothetical protein